MKIPTLQALPANLQTVITASQRGDGFAAFLSTRSDGTLPKCSEAPSEPSPAGRGDLAALLSELQTEMTEDLSTFPDLSPAGLERLERAMASKIAERLSAFDAEHGTAMMDQLGGGTSGDLAARLFQAMATGPASARTSAQSLTSAITQVARPLGIEMSHNTETGRLEIHQASAPQGKVKAPMPAAGSARHRGDALPAGAAPNAEEIPHPENAAPSPARQRGSFPTAQLSETAGHEPRSAQDPLRAAPTAPDHPRAAPAPSGPAAPSMIAIPSRSAEPPVSPAPLPPLAPAAPSAPAAAPAAPAPATPPAPSEPSVLDQIRRVGVTTGRTRIELAPEGLGTLEIDLSADEAGQLRVVVRAENAAVLSMLRGDRAGLLNALGESGLSFGEAGLDFENFEEGRRNGSDRSEATGREPPRSSAEEESLETRPADPASYRSRPLEGRLDILT